MLKAFRSHIRSNVVGYLALVVAMSGTGAWAADKITASDIAKNAVRAKHIKVASVTEPKIAPGAVTAAKLAGDVDNTQILWANVQGPVSSPTLIRGKGATDVSVGGTGRVRVRFNRDVRPCSYQVSGWTNDEGATYLDAPIFVVERSVADTPVTGNNVVTVEAYSGSSGAVAGGANYDFTVAVFC